MNRERAGAGFGEVGRALFIHYHWLFYLLIPHWKCTALFDPDCSDCFKIDMDHTIFHTVLKTRLEVDPAYSSLPANKPSALGSH